MKSTPFFLFACLSSAVETGCDRESLIKGLESYGFEVTDEYILAAEEACHSVLRHKLDTTGKDQKTTSTADEIAPQQVEQSNYTSDEVEAEDNSVSEVHEPADDPEFPLHGEEQRLADEWLVYGADDDAGDDLSLTDGNPEYTNEYSVRYPPEPHYPSSEADNFEAEYPSPEADIDRIIDIIDSERIMSEPTPPDNDTDSIPHLESSAEFFRATLEQQLDDEQQEARAFLRATERNAMTSELERLVHSIRPDEALASLYTMGNHDFETSYDEDDDIAAAGDNVHLLMEYTDVDAEAIVPDAGPRLGDIVRHDLNTSSSDYTFVINNEQQLHQKTSESQDAPESAEYTLVPADNIGLRPETIENSAPMPPRTRFEELLQQYPDLLTNIQPATRSVYRQPVYKQISTKSRTTETIKKPLNLKAQKGVVRHQIVEYPRVTTY